MNYFYKSYKELFKYLEDSNGGNYIHHVNDDDHD